MTATNARKRDLQRKRPSRPVRPNMGTSLRKLPPPTTLRTPEGHKNYKPSPKNTTTTGSTLPDNLNDFYIRFDKQSTTPPSSVRVFHCYEPPSSFSSSSSSNLLPPFTVDESVVKRVFQQLNSNKAANPDNKYLLVYLNNMRASSQVSSQTCSVCLFPNVKSPIAPNSQLSSLFPINLLNNDTECRCPLIHLSVDPRFCIEHTSDCVIGGSLSSSLTLSTGTSQRCVLSPILYSLRSYDFVFCHESTHILKYADDTTVLGLITNSDESEYRDQVNKRISWCSENNLELNVNKST